MCEELFDGKTYDWIEDELIHTERIPRRHKKSLTIHDIVSLQRENSDDPRYQRLKSLFQPYRLHDVLFDNQTGFYCSIYATRIPKQALPFQLKANEIRKPTPLAEIKDPAQLAPMTLFALHMLAQREEDRLSEIVQSIPARFQREPTNISYAKIDQVYYKLSEEGKPLSEATRSVNNSYFIDF